ncbi:MAG: hypothetical protein HY721_13960 [Planctomycetes bacterium]|nr:hypothetical protein [Planctomycetota bacterium]
MNASRWLLVCAPLLVVSEVAGNPLPPRYFPLDPGNRWTYGSENGIGGTRTVTVLGYDQTSGLIRVDFGYQEALVQERQSDIDILIEGEGLAPYYRFDEAVWRHRDLNDCDDGVDMKAAGVEDVETPARLYLGCLRIEYSGTPCADAGTSIEWWAPEVGRVKWVEDSIAGPRAWVLLKFERGVKIESPFRRGDEDGNGKVDISDAVYGLNWLFTGGSQPACLDAADADDNGHVELTDAIRVLGYLFLGSAEPPAPGPKVCGEDPTPDDLPACAYPGCEEA